MESVSKKTKVSQQKIAADLGVSQALVSMVLNGRNKGIHPETYRRIWEHAVSLGYAPKGMLMANGAGNGARPTQVGFVLRPGLTLYTQSNFFSHVQHGLHAFLEKEGATSLFLGTETTLTENQFRNLDQLKQQLIGVVVMGEVTRPFLTRLRQSFPRLVAVSASYPGFCHSVLSNEVQAVELLIEHLFALGHRSFAWIGGNEGMGRHKQRFAAFQQALERVGGECRPEHIGIVAEGDRMEGRVVAERLLAQAGERELPTAWVAYNGLMARGAANCLLSRQIRIPEEVSIVAVDGTRICEEEEPTLTSAFADPEKMGAVTGELLLKATGAPDEALNDLVLPATLKVRHSTGPARKALAAPRGR